MQTNDRVTPFVKSELRSFVDPGEPSEFWPIRKFYLIRGVRSKMAASSVIQFQSVGESEKQSVLPTSRRQECRNFVRAGVNFRGKWGKGEV